MDTPLYPDPTQNPHTLVWKNVPELRHVKKLTCECDGSADCQYSPGAGSPKLGHFEVDQAPNSPVYPSYPTYRPRPVLLQHTYRYSSFDGTAQWRPIATSHLAITKQRHNYYRAPLSPSGSNLRNRQIARRRVAHPNHDGQYTLAPSGGQNDVFADHQRTMALDKLVFTRSHEVCHSCFVDKQNSVETPQRSKSADDLVSSGNITGAQDSVESTPDPSTPDLNNTDTTGVADAPTLNGDMKVGSGVLDGTGPVKTPPAERKTSKMSAFSRFFKPWKWRRRKKPSEKIEKTAVGE